MHFKSLIFILLASWLSIAYSETAMPSRYYRLAYYNSPSKVRGIEHLDDMISSEPMDDEDEFENDSYSQLSARQQSASTGRLFFKRLFGQQQQQQPIIPIIVTGASNNQAVTSTGSIPSATGTITTSPAGRRGLSVEDDEDGIQANAEAYDEEKTQVSLSKPGAEQEYVVTHPDIQGTANQGSNSEKKAANYNLRRPGQDGNYVKVRVPPSYTKYFKNGQKVILRAPKKANNRRRRNNSRNRRRKVWN